jgi:ribosome biogenesis GTPase
MAKRKGKSRNRQQDWQRVRRPDADAGEDVQNRRRIAHRRVRLPGQAQDAAIFAETGPGNTQLTGLVAQLYPGGAIVRTGPHGDLLCGVAGTFRPAPNASALAVGDIVTLALTADAERLAHAGQLHLDPDRVDGMILQRGPRETALSRPQPMRGKRRDAHATEVFEKVIAANMDQLAVVASVAQPPMRRRLLDRYRIIAERGELPLALVVTKTDLGEPDRVLLADHEALGTPIVFCSSVAGDGIDGVRALLAGKRTILAGASGVGKSSLLNALLPGLDAATREIRASDNRGRHTTSAAVLYELPFGGQVVDTPGIRELGVEIDPAELPWYFPEFEPFSPQCRFNDCTHTHEPGCAVQQAVEAGQIPHRRFESYLRIHETLT